MLVIVAVGKGAPPFRLRFEANSLVNVPHPSYLTQKRVHYLMLKAVIFDCDGVIVI